MRRYLTIGQKQLAIQLHVRGFNNSFIARQFQCNRLKISNMINAWKKGHFLKHEARSHRKTKLTAQQVYNVLNYFVKNPFNTKRWKLLKKKVLIEIMEQLYLNIRININELKITIVSMYGV